MKEDLLRELGHLGITARLKRLSDSISYSIRKLYQARGIDIEPSWHLIFLLLEQEGTSTMTDIADTMQYSQAAVTKIIKKMEGKGYLKLATDPGDQRRKLIQLTPKAKRKLPQFKAIWQAGQAVIAEMLDGNEAFLVGLTHFENQQKQSEFSERVLLRLAQKEETI